MKTFIISLLLLLAMPLTSIANQDAVEQLFAKFKAAAAFDHAFPREKVFLHLDNNAYFEGDSLWFKAYVVRASSLKATDISRVLYVELLDAAGVVLERQLAKVDTMGTAMGCLNLQPYHRTGFYEVRAYTRAMLNWGEAACFSRVIPVFERNDKSVSIDTPDADWKLPATAKRTFAFEGSKVRNLTFYPEGGNRVSNLQQRVAYWLTDGDHKAVSDTVWIYNAENRKVAWSVPLHEGRGVVQLPPLMGEGYAMVGKERFELPTPLAEGYTLRADLAEGYLDLRVERSENMPYETIGLAVFCREQACYFDTLSVASVEEFSLPADVLRGGVNRIELFNTAGQSLASRLVFNSQRLHQQTFVEVTQNAPRYEAYAPISLNFKVKDASGTPCKAQMSVAVRDDSQELVATGQSSIDVAMLLSSEIKGYIHNPHYYFSAADDVARQALDHLLLVQGWTATPFATMCNHDAFSVVQPIEDQLILNGVAYKDNDRREPYSNMRLNLSMYNKAGDVRRGECTTDAEGRFAFASSIDYEGDWLAQVTTREEGGKKVWSRVAFDRWFAPVVRTFSPLELTYNPPTPMDSLLTTQAVKVDADIVQWDALDDDDPYTLGVAEVEGKRIKRYKPLNGNRFKWNGGKNRGKRFADETIDIEREVEKWRDAGYDSRVHVMELINVALGKTKMGMVAKVEDGSFNMEAMEVNPFLEEAEASAETSTEADANKNEPTASEKLAKMESLNDVKQYIEVDGENWIVDYTAGRGNAEFAEDFDVAYIIRGDNHIARYIGAQELEEARKDRGPIEALLILHEQYDMPRAKKGITFRKVWGYAPAKQFFSPNYNQQDLPSEPDMRRTLLWQPKLTTSDAGEASVLLFNNASHLTAPRISVQGMTYDGRFFSFER